MVADGHGCHTALYFDVKAKKSRQSSYVVWLPKLHKKSYKARFIAYSSSDRTIELSKMLTSSLTAVKICY